MNPLIRVRVAQLLARRYHLDPLQAVNAAEDLAKVLAAGNLDIVLSSWVNDVGKPQQKEDFWDGVSRQIENIDDTYGDWHPWRP